MFFRYLKDYLIQGNTYDNFKKKKKFFNVQIWKDLQDLLLSENHETE